MSCWTRTTTVDGIRTITVKFMEMVVLIQTRREPESIVKDGWGLLFGRFAPWSQASEAAEAGRGGEEDIRRHGQVPRVCPHQQCQPHDHDGLTDQHCHCEAEADLHAARDHDPVDVAANFPPTLAKSQVSSVRKHLKNQLLSLLRHPTAAENFFTNMTTLLTDLGANRDEVIL